jgi:hypothetical protein
MYSKISTRTCSFALINLGGKCMHAWGRSSQVYLFKERNREDFEVVGGRGREDM